MNTNMKRWIREAIAEMDGEFTAKTIRQKIVEKRGTSPYIGNNTAIGWFLNKHCTDVVQICKGHSSKTYRRTTNDD
jgi:hypothetical protein